MDDSHNSKSIIKTNNSDHMKILKYTDLIGCTFLTPPTDGGIIFVLVLLKLLINITMISGIILNT